MQISHSKSIALVGLTVPNEIRVSNGHHVCAIDHSLASVPIDLIESCGVGQGIMVGFRVVDCPLSGESSNKESITINDVCSISIAIDGIVS